MARISFVVLVLVALLFGYDQYRIQQLQGEVSAISGKVHGKKGGSSDLVTPLAQAQRHVMNAKVLIGKKKTAQAQAELDKVLVNLKSANTVSEDITGSIADSLGKARDTAVTAFQKTWKDISEQATTKKVDAKK